MTGRNKGVVLPETSEERTRDPYTGKADSRKTLVIIGIN